MTTLRRAGGDRVRPQPATPDHTPGRHVPLEPRAPRPPAAPRPVPTRRRRRP